MATGEKGSLGGGGEDGGGKGETNVYICVQAYILKTGDQRRGGGERVAS